MWLDLLLLFIVALCSFVLRPPQCRGCAHVPVLGPAAGGFQPKEYLWVY